MGWPAFATWGRTTQGWVGDTPRYYHARADQADRWLRRHRQVDLEHARPGDLKAWWDQLPTHPNTRNTYLAAVRAWYRWWTSTGMRQDDPTVKIDRLKVRPGTPRAPHPGQVAQVLASADATGGAGMVGVYLMAYAGLRIAEACSLRTTDVQAGWVNVTGKGEKERALPVHPELAACLHRWEATEGRREWLTPSPVTGGPLSTGAMRERVKAIMADAGFPAMVPHQLRHGAATHLLECGADVATVSAFLGHASLSTTTVYLKVRPGRLKEAVGHMTWTSDEVA